MTITTSLREIHIKIKEKEKELIILIAAMFIKVEFFNND